MYKIYMHLENLISLMKRTGFRKFKPIELSRLTSLFNYKITSIWQACLWMMIFVIATLISLNKKGDD